MIGGVRRKGGGVIRMVLYFCFFAVAVSVVIDVGGVEEARGVFVDTVKEICLSESAR